LFPFAPKSESPFGFGSDTWMPYGFFQVFGLLSSSSPKKAAEIKRFAGNLCSFFVNLRV
jgi:hypothetical protein